MSQPTLDELFEKSKIQNKEPISFSDYLERLSEKLTETEIRNLELAFEDENEKSYWQGYECAENDAEDGFEHYLSKLKEFLSENLSPLSSVETVLNKIKQFENEN